MLTEKTPLKELQIWMSAYEKVNGEVPMKDVKAKIKELLKVVVLSSKKKDAQIYFRDSVWCSYTVLRDELLKDRKFINDYQGVDLKAYIEQAMAWSEKGNKSTDLGWMLTLKNWMRSGKNDGKLIMKPQKEKQGFVNH